MRPCQGSSLILQSLDEKRIKRCRCRLREFVSNTVFVEALGHNMVMLHSDQEPMLVQLLKGVQSRRVKRTQVTHAWPKSQPSESGQDRKRKPSDQRGLPFDVPVT